VSGRRRSLLRRLVPAMGSGYELRWRMRLVCASAGWLELSVCL
jgi:hypothetical protein